MNNEVITATELAKAIRKVTGRMTTEDAQKTAEHLLAFFGFDTQVIDNALNPDDRLVFYMMEDCGIVSADKEDAQLPDGRDWRICYWTLRQDKINSILTAKVPEEPTPETPDIYSTIPTEEWLRE